MLDIKYPLSLGNVEDLFVKRGIDICHQTVRFWWNRLSPMFAAEIFRERVRRLCQANVTPGRPAKLANANEPQIEGQASQSVPVFQLIA